MPIMLDLRNDTDGPLVVDLCSGAGGAAMGYYRAGFRVVCIDNVDQPRNPFEFIKADVTEFDLVGYCRSANVVAVVGSPPCKVHTTLKASSAPHHVDLIPRVRAMMQATGLPYIIENVPGAPLIDPIRLCGSMFNTLNVLCRDRIQRELRRHRHFESNIELREPRPCRHIFKTISVFGTGSDRAANNPRTDGKGGSPYRGILSERETAMGINWMNRAELSEAIPPVYTEYLGRQLMRALRT